MRHVLKCGEAYMETASGVVAVPDAGICVEGGRITAVGAADGVTVELGRYRVLPGLVDIHVHGGNGADVMDATHESLAVLREHKLAEGVTAFCPTTVTAPMEKLRAALGVIREAKNRPGGAKVIGAFIEGPYISTVYKGAHPAEFIRDIALDELRQLVELGGGSVTSVALAPELEYAVQATEYLVSAGVSVRLGHSGATAERANAAIAAGASMIVHTFNAMSAFNHREPGMAGAALSNPAVYAELICDLLHVHPLAMRILLNARGKDKIVLITDCMSAGGLPDGEYRLGELPVTVKDSAARLTEGGALAGSTLSLIQAVRNMHEAVGVGLADAVAMASTNAAAALGISDIGGIRPGKRADIIAIDDDYTVVFVMLDGQVVLDRRGS